MAGIRSKIAFTRHPEKLLETGTGPAYTALDRAHCAAADGRSFFVGKASRTNENDRFALIVGQLVEGLTEILQVKPAVLFRVNGKTFAEQPVSILHLAPALAHLTVKFVAKNCK